MAWYQKHPGRPSARSNLTRVSVAVFKVLSQDLDGRAANHILKEYLGEYYEFLVPDTLFEQLSHNWSPSQNVAGRLGQVAQGVNKTLKEAKAVVSEGNQMKANLFKVDSPIMYENSDRRKFNLTVQLRDQNYPEENIAIVNAFKRYSAAKIGEGEALAKIDFPYIFEVATVPNDWFVIQNAFLASIQVTYGEFKGGSGYPAHVDMILNFEDLEPLYEKTLKQRATVTTTGTLK